MSLATSIDALAVGLSLSVLGISIVVSGLAIGLVTIVLSFLGVYLGYLVGAKLSNRVGAFGGLILIGVGVKIVLDHLGVS